MSAEATGGRAAHAPIGGQAPLPAGAPAGAAPIVAAALGYAAFAVAPVALAAVATKADKVSTLRTISGAGATTVEALWPLAVADIAFALGLLCATAAAAAVGPIARRRVCLVVVHALLAACGLLLVVEHGFFRSTGSPLDLPMVDYTLQNAAMLQAVLASELDALSVAGAALCLVASGLPLLHRAGRQRWRAAATSAGAPFVAPAWVPFAFGLAAALALAAAPALGRRARAKAVGSLAVVAEAPLVALAAGAPALWADAGTLPALADRPAAPLVVARTARSRDLNVVIVALESVRASATTPYAPKLATTPFLAGVAARGLRAERAYTAVPHTTKSLLPIHCGYYPKVAPGYDEAHLGALPTECLAATLGRLGWATAYVQSSEDVFEKNHQLVENFGYRRGIALAELRQGGAHERFDEIGYFGLEDQAMVEPALAYIDGLHGQPFVLGMVTLASHHPYDVPASWRRQRFDADPKRDDYFNAIAATDAALASFYEGLRRRGLLERTVFVYIGDHGEGFGEHGLFQHDEVLYEEGVRVPLLIEAPGLAPRVVGGLRQNIDVVPTVLELLGLELVAGQLDGRSLLSTPGHARLPLGCWHKDRCLAEIEATPGPTAAAPGGLRKVIDYHGRRKPEAFDLRADPDERRDLIAAGALQEAALRPAIERLRAWKAASLQRYAGQDARRAEALVTTTPPADHVPGRALDVRFGVDGRDIVRLLALRWEGGRADAGGSTAVELLWQVLGEVPAGWQPFLHGVSRDALALRHSWVPAEGSHPLSAWRAGQFIRDRVFVRPEPGTGEGHLDVLLGFWRPGGDARMEVRASPGRSLLLTGEGRVLLGQLWIDNPEKPRRAGPQRQVDIAGLPGLERFSPGALPPLDIAFVQPPANLPEPPTAGAAALPEVPVIRVGAASVEGPRCPGRPHTLRLRLQVERQPPRYSRLFVHLRGPGGAHRNLEFQPLGGALPVDDLRAGDLVETPRPFSLPADWPLGTAEVLIGFYGPNVVGEGQRMPPRPAAVAVGRDKARVLRFDVRACPP